MCVYNTLALKRFMSYMKAYCKGNPNWLYCCHHAIEWLFLIDWAFDFVQKVLLQHTKYGTINILKGTWACNVPKIPRSISYSNVWARIHQKNIICTTAATTTSTSTSTSTTSTNNKPTTTNRPQIMGLHLTGLLKFYWMPLHDILALTHSGWVKIYDTLHMTF